jgi:hypothetical protein
MERDHQGGLGMCYRIKWSDGGITCKILECAVLVGSWYRMTIFEKVGKLLEMLSV